MCNHYGSLMCCQNLQAPDEGEVTGEPRLAAKHMVMNFQSLWPKTHGCLLCSMGELVLAFPSLCSYFTLVSYGVMPLNFGLKVYVCHTQAWDRWQSHVTGNQ